jgi:hypothetical protein
MSYKHDGSLIINYTAYYPLYNTENLISLRDLRLHPLIHTGLEFTLALGVVGSQVKATEKSPHWFGTPRP